MTANEAIATGRKEGTDSAQMGGLEWLWSGLWKPRIGSSGGDRSGGDRDSPLPGQPSPPPTVSERCETDDLLENQWHGQLVVHGAPDAPGVLIQLRLNANGALVDLFGALTGRARHERVACLKASCGGSFQATYVPDEVSEAQGAARRNVQQPSNATP